MSANQAFFPIATMGRVLGVSTAGYYAWRSRLPSARAIADDALLRRLRTIHAVSRGTYGAPRVHAELRAEGRAVGKKRIARLMRAAGIVGVSRRRSVITTRRDRDARPAPDLVDRNFTADRPNQVAEPAASTAELESADRDQPTSSGSKRFEIDSPLEEGGFEPSVPRAKESVSLAEGNW